MPSNGEEVRPPDKSGVSKRIAPPASRLVVQQSDARQVGLVRPMSMRQRLFDSPQTDPSARLQAVARELVGEKWKNYSMKSVVAMRMAPELPGPRLYYRAKEAAALLGLSLRTIYEGIYAGWIPSRKIGNARLIPAAWLLALTDREADGIAASFRSGDFNSPKNQYYLGNGPSARGGPLRLLKRLFQSSCFTWRNMRFSC